MRHHLHRKQAGRLVDERCERVRCKVAKCIELVVLLLEQHLYLIWGTHRVKDRISYRRQFKAPISTDARIEMKLSQGSRRADDLYGCSSSYLPRQCEKWYKNGQKWSKWPWLPDPRPGVGTFLNLLLNGLLLALPLHPSAGKVEDD